MNFILRLFLIIFSANLFLQHKFTDAREISNTDHSLILRLTHSTTATITQSQYITPQKKPLQLLGVSEPLKEVRDGYIISLNLGTPSQAIQVIFDTGSDLTWVPCGNLSFDCIDCEEYRNKFTTSSFSTSYSSSSLRDSCSSPFCIDLHSSDNPFDPCTMSGCSLTTLMRTTCLRPCPSFAYTYGDGVVTGTLTRDVLKVHAANNNSNPNYSTVYVSKFRFGCVSSSYRQPIGIAGFGKGPLSIPSQLGFLRKGFSHCFLPFKFANDPNISSPLVVGDLAVSSKEYMQFTPMLKSPMYPNYYYIGLERITVVGGKNNTSSSDASAQIPLTLREFDSSGNGGMFIDSGTTYTHLPEPFYSRLLSILQSIITHPRDLEVEERWGFDLCYRVPCTSGDILQEDDIIPEITFHFLNNVSLTLPQGNTFYAMSAPVNSTVAKCLLFRRMEDGDLGPSGIFGSFQQQNVEVVYDLDKERIGFQVTDCALSAASQGLKKA